MDGDGKFFVNVRGIMNFFMAEAGFGDGLRITRKIIMEKFCR